MSTNNKKEEENLKPKSECEQKKELLKKKIKEKNKLLFDKNTINK